MPLSPLANRYDQFILDLDGCVWVGGEPTPGVVEALEELRAAGKRLAFATNNAYESGEDLVAQLWKIGVRASLRDVVTVGGAMQHVLAETRTGRTAFVIGTAAMHRHVTDAGLRVLNGTDLASRAEVVVVAGTTELVYDDLRIAVQAVLRGADLLATARDPTYPQPDGLWPGTGAVLAAVEYATGRTAEIVGKPEPQLFQTALDRLGEGPHAGRRRPRGLRPGGGGRGRARRRARPERRHRPRRSSTASSRSRWRWARRWRELLARRS